MTDGHDFPGASGPPASSTGVPPAPGAATPPPGSAAAIPPERPRTAPRASDDDRRDRPAPSPASLLGVVSGLLLALALLLFIGEIDGNRWPGVALCLGFQVVGFALMFLQRGRRGETAGVALSALAVIPLVILLFVDPKDPGIETPNDFTGTATGVLVVAALLWLAAWAFAPARRYAFFLGAALVSFFLIGVIQITDDPIQDAWTSSTATTPIITPGATGSFEFDSDEGWVEVYDDEAFADDGYWTSDGEWVDGYWTSDGEWVDGSFGGGGSTRWDVDEGATSGNDVATQLGWLSLVFGLGYLAIAWFRDRAGDARMATPFVAVSIPALFGSVAWLASSFGQAGTSFLALVLASAAIAVGTAGRRRALSWFGVIGITGGLLGLIDLVAGDSPRGVAIACSLVGIAIAMALFVFEGLPSTGASNGTAPSPGGGGGAGGTTAVTPTAPPSDAPVPPVSPGPPTSPAAWAPPWEPSTPPGEGGAPGGASPWAGPTGPGPTPPAGPPSAPGPWSGPGPSSPG